LRVAPAARREDTGDSMLNYAAIDASVVATEPFPYFMTKSVLQRSELEAIQTDFPDVTGPGVFPLEELSCKGAFERLVEDIRSPELEAILGGKFGIDLADKPLMITVRGFCQQKDGRIHTDSTDKLVTCLLYLNADWQQQGGRLRLLRNGHDIEDVIAEVPPDGGTLVAFKRTDNSWHGHLPFVGPRRYVMFNWVRSEAALSRNILRHRISAKLKSIGLFR